jgi:hypothetical protein
MKYTRYYLAECEADTIEEADAIFEDDGAEFGPRVDLISSGASIEHKPVEPGLTIVVCVRDPDWDNAYEVFPGDQPGVSIFDIDLGRADLSEHSEFVDWFTSHKGEVDALRAGGHTAAADHYLSIITEQAPEGFDPEDPEACICTEADDPNDHRKDCPQWGVPSV